MRWQYRRMEVEISALGSAAFGERLDRLGDEGWQLVNAVQHVRHGSSHEVHLVFQRAAFDAGEMAVQ